MSAMYGTGNTAANSSMKQSSSITRRRNFNIGNQNHGYDTTSGFYQVINGDHLAYRYETIEELGRGTFGQVIHCVDHKTGQRVAVKMSKNLS